MYSRLKTLRLLLFIIFFIHTHTERHIYRSTYVCGGTVIGKAIIIYKQLVHFCFYIMLLYFLHLFSYRTYTHTYTYVHTDTRHDKHRKKCSVHTVYRREDDGKHLLLHTRVRRKVLQDFLLHTHTYIHIHNQTLIQFYCFHIIKSV